MDAGGDVKGDAGETSAAESGPALEPGPAGRGARRLALRVATARSADAVYAAVRGAYLGEGDGAGEGLSRERVCAVLRVLAHAETALPPEVFSTVQSVLREEDCARAERACRELVGRDDDEAVPGAVLAWARAAWDAGGEGGVRSACARIWSLVRPRGRAAALVVDSIRNAQGDEGLRVALYLALIDRGADPRAALADELALRDESRARVCEAFASRARNAG